MIIVPEHLSKQIFVSHAATDTEIANKVVDLLNTAMGIDVHNSVFCSSLEGLKIPPGKDFTQYIKEQIQHPKIVLLLISQNYLASPFCLAEAGASWAMSHRIVPMLIPPTKYEDMKAVLVGVQALNVSDPSDWNEALTVFKAELGIDPNVNRWERKRDEKIAEIEALLQQQLTPPTVPSYKFQEVEAKLKDANEEITELESERARLEKLVEQIKVAKDAQEVARIELENLPSAETFDKLMHAARCALRPFKGAIWDAFYYFFRKDSLPLPPPGSLDSTERWGEIRKGVEDGYLIEKADENIALNEEDPGVKRAIGALSALRDFIRNTPDLAVPYKNEHDHQLDFGSRRFWQTNLQ